MAIISFSRLNLSSDSSLEGVRTLNTLCVIPSRYASTRLPGKPLIEICGKPLIQWVYERASSAVRLNQVLVATDDVRIKEAVESFGGKAVMSPSALPCGTDRVARVLEDFNLDSDVILNLQGDEPLIDPADLDRLVDCFSTTPGLEMASLMAALHSEEDVLDPNQVKVVVDQNQYALYFSRHAIPYWRKREQYDWTQRPAPYWLHLGVYAFNRATLQNFSTWARSPLEIAESLEQLRALEHGVRIKMITTPHPWPGVNTPEDVERVAKTIEKQRKKGIL